MTAPATIRVYNAGDLFTHQALGGNARLAREVYRVSKGEVSFHNPQDLIYDLRGTDRPAKRVRDNNLLSILESDVVVCNFEGLEIDSGTVNESAVASAVGMPRVLFRSDTRRPILPALGPEDRGRLSEDGFVDDTAQSELESGWNLMMKDYPRTVLAEYPALFRYQTLLGDLRELGQDETVAAELEIACQAADQMVAEIADLLVKAIGTVIRRPRVFSTDEQAVEAYVRLADFTGIEVPGAKPSRQALEELARQKLSRATL